MSSWRLPYEPYTAFLVMVRGATYAGEDSNIPKGADTHALAEKKIFEMIVPTRLFSRTPSSARTILLVMIKGDNPAETLELVREILEDVQRQGLLC